MVELADARIRSTLFMVVNTMRSPVLPTARLLGAVAIAMLSGVLCAWLVLQPPSLGLGFRHTAEGATLRLATVDAQGPDAAHAGDSLVALSSTAHGAIMLETRDLIEEPDFLDQWVDEDAFYARQSAIRAILTAPDVTLTLRDSAGAERRVSVVPHARPLSSLPLIFWLQLLFGAAGLIIGTWVWALRPADWGPRAYALTGACFLIFAHAAAVYSAREIALSGPLFRALSGINHFGSIHFGAALCALFLVYPIRLTSARVPIGLGVAAFVWWLLCVTRVMPDQDWGSRFPVMLTMLGALIISIVQWRRTRGDPAARTVLRWFAVSVLTGCGTFVGLIAVASAIGGLPPIPQGYAFGFFVLMYAGLAIGLRQYRLFDLDQWAYRILFWGLTIAVILAIDLWMIGSARSGTAQTLTLIAVLALGTLPLRRWIWAKLIDRKQLAPEQLFEKALHVTYAVSDVERDARWRALLVELFDPLHAAPDGALNASRDVKAVALMATGQELAVPAVASSPALRLTYADGGKRLFTPADEKLVQTLVTLMQSANDSRLAYDAGVSRERTRIARDLHDTVSSPLLAGLAPLAGDAPDGARMHAVQNEIRRAVRGMRSVVSGDAVAAAPLADCIADARFAAVERLTAAGLSVEWPVVELGESVLGPDERHALTAFLQESITNVIRHAGATSVAVRVRVTDDELRCTIVDDGKGFAPDLTRTGDGLPNLRARAEALHGLSSIGPRRDGHAGTEVSLVAALNGSPVQS
jgi:signal transduction histidine kinase